MNFDGGHYFLTALSPVRAEPMARDDGSITSSTALLREALASLPTAIQSEACADSGHCSPFARCRRTHFARLVVIDQPSFNGRDAGNAIVQSVRKTDLLAHQPVDKLTRAWLVLAIDFDAGAGADHGLHDYLAGLWGLMSAELGEVYRHCHGFDAVKDDDGFARYIERCQVETTMPFNDYWTTPLKLPALNPLVVVIAAVGAALAVAWLVTRLVGITWGWSLALLPFTLAAALYGAFRFVTSRGLKPFPAAPGSNLRTILKALHLQQNFARFAVAHQSMPAPALHSAFGSFAAALRPDDNGGPTQAPGEISS